MTKREESATVLGVDLGGTKVMVGEVTADGAVVDAMTFPSDVTSQTRAIECLNLAIGTYMDVHAGDRIRAIGVDVVGRVSPRTGVWHELWPGNGHPIDLAQELRDTWGMPVGVANDVCSATLAELRYGIGREVDDFVYLNIGTGIAGRIVSGGRVISGAHDDAGEVGHMVVDAGSPVRCQCGRMGCVEPLASGLGMSQEAHRLSVEYPSTALRIVAGERVSVLELSRAYEDGDELARRVIDHGAAMAADLIMNLVRVSDPDAVVLGGGVVNSEPYMRALRDELVPQTMRLASRGVLKTQLNPNQIALMGCSVIGIEALEGVEAR